MSRKEKENRGTQQLFRELSAAAVASCVPTPSAPGLWTLDKQLQHTPEARLAHTQISGLAPTPETLGGRVLRSAAWVPKTEIPGGPATRSATRLPGHTGPKRPGGCIPQTMAWWPHLKPWMGMHLNQWPGSPQLKSWVGAHPNQLPGSPGTETKSRGSVCTQISSLADWREKSETNPYTNPFLFHQQENQQNWPDQFKASRRLFFFNSFFLSVLLSFFVPSSFLPLLFYSFFLPSFIYFLF